MQKKKGVRASASAATSSAAYASTRNVLLRCGMELLTEQGFHATGLDAVLKRATVPKGSFYYYFGSKETFGLAVMDAYDDYFGRKLDRWLANESRAPLDRLHDFVADASAGMRKHKFTRGCLVGNLSQELGALPEQYRARLDSILSGWQHKVASTLLCARQQGALPVDVDCERLAEFFWISWEGAVLRARLVRSERPLNVFIDSFLLGLRGPDARSASSAPLDTPV